jgi:GTPase involved in cell partitioning and DNA repair
VLYEKVLKETAILIVINKVDKLQKENDLEIFIKKFSLKEMLK